MTETELFQLVAEWDSYPDEEDHPTPRYYAMLDRLEWFGRKEWPNYVPAQHPSISPAYINRLARWIGNAQSADERKLLLEYALHITFFSESDFYAMYQSAFLGPITRWILDQLNLKLTDSHFLSTLDTELQKHTWYCPITDSLRISDFYHINHISGIGRRPAFRELYLLAKGAKAGSIIDENAAYMVKKHLKRLVLIEDFVGSGNQARNTIEWVLQAFACPVLFVPLIICPGGCEMATGLQEKYPHTFSFRPVIRLKPEDLLGTARRGRIFGRAKFAERLEQLALDTFAQVAGPNFHDTSRAPHTPLGYEESGCSVVTFTNTPDNTLPIVHHRPPSDTWYPLFPRSSRV